MSRIQHTVAFRLVHASGSEEEQAFLSAAQTLADIPGVEAFAQLRQIGAKAPYTFGFSMEFADQAAYDAYNTHPTHVAFVRDRWASEVAEFQELDYVAL